MAVIDTQVDSVIRLFETGPLPKMVATSPDGTRLAVTHWGNNTVGLMDISSDNPDDWHYLASLVVDYELKLNFSLTAKVDRDVNSGYCLRGTVFTPDGRYLLVGCMGGGGGIAVIDLSDNRYLGRVLGAMPNLRHIVIRNDYIYCSINNLLTISPYNKFGDPEVSGGVTTQGYDSGRYPFPRTYMFGVQVGF